MSINRSDTYNGLLNQERMMTPNRPLVSGSILRRFRSGLMYIYLVHCLDNESSLKILKRIFLRNVNYFLINVYLLYHYCKTIYRDMSAIRNNNFHGVINFIMIKLNVCQNVDKNCPAFTLNIIQSSQQVFLKKQNVFCAFFPW